jgi:hypothetical protein
MMTPSELAEKMKAEILADVENGIVPASVVSFSELHDYVDANLYGGTEALLEELDAEVPDTDEGHSAALAALCSLANPAMDAVDKWIRSGGITAERFARGTW